MPQINRGPIRARDLRTNIAELGFEKGVVVTLEHLLDEQAGMRQTLREMAELLSTCINQVERMVNAGSAMAEKLKQMERDSEQDG